MANSAQLVPDSEQPTPHTAQLTPDATYLACFYEDTYTKDPQAASLYSRWRALSAEGKAEHVIALCVGADLQPASTLEVGCGDGAVLCELHDRDFGGRLQGVEIAQAAVEIARHRPEIDAVDVYDGERLPMPDRTHDLGVLSHVLEHVRDPAGLLAETARVCRGVVVEVPLEDNLSARRPGKRRHAAEVGHLRRLSRSAVQEIVAEAGLRVAGELEDPLPLAVHSFFAETALVRVGARIKWRVRKGLHGLAPGVARRLFTVHYACLCLPMDAGPMVR
jgi:ubiquinone/menaquinone biosynthesis C-methylase UbiE